jgi:hypothetical protein
MNYQSKDILLEKHQDTVYYSKTERQYQGVTTLNIIIEITV